MKESDVNDLIELIESADETAVAEIDKRIDQHETAIGTLRRLRKLLGAPQKKTRRAGGSSSGPSGPKLRELVSGLLQESGKPMLIAEIATKLDRKEQAVRMLGVKCPDLFRIDGNLVTLIG